MKRELTADEKTICLKSFDRIKEEIEDQKYLLKKIDLELTEGLKATERELERKYKAVKKNYDFNVDQLKVLEDQMLNGVEIKEKVEIEEEIKEVIEDVENE